MSNILYVYGTLRPGNADTVKVKGQLYDLGWFPGIKLVGTGDVICEKIEVDDWQAVDRYEGYMPSDPANSLYIRVPFGDGFIYEFNRDVNPVNLVPTGPSGDCDWLDYTQEKRGINGKRF